MKSPKASTSKTSTSKVKKTGNFLDTVLSASNKKEFTKKTKEHANKEIANFKKQKVSYEDVKAFVKGLYGGDLGSIISINFDITNAIKLNTKDFASLGTFLDQYEQSKELLKSYMKYNFPKKKGLLKTAMGLVKPKSKQAYKELEESNSSSNPENITMDMFAENLLIVFLYKSLKITVQDENLQIYSMR